MSEHRVLDPTDLGDHEVLDRLMSEIGDDAILDTTAEQLQSLDALLPTPSSELLDEPTRWVHYPWRRSLVRVLGPRGFRLLRLDRNRNKITVGEQDAARRLRVGVVGLSVGHAVAHTLALEGLCGELRLADFDDLDLSNLNRVPASVFDLGVNKAVLAARRIAELDPYLEVTTFPTGIDEATTDAFLADLDIVVEECDSIDAKVLVRQECRRRGIPVIMETSDGGVLDIERYDLEPDRPYFHGLLGDVDAAAVAGMTPREKAPLAGRILEMERITPRMAASLPDIGTTLSTWPQLGSDVALGGASVAAVVRLFGRGTPPPSGRVRVGLEAIIESTLVDPYRG
ncbi:Rv1355c family protein [Rhodococcus sp. BP-332]|uniref:Rv1355c family protein n=1 Tax=Rhodococcus sp. BP-332 TaxID=2739447 RepID=UPI001C9AB948|nr:Rv1355c family protein [Rhodococcus sp. BP-332]MBY6678478.1 Rv1355c family protein [Rhodococcus sp. BP-332]